MSRTDSPLLPHSTDSAAPQNRSTPRSSRVLPVRSDPRFPQLLVSVRDAREAATAIRADVSIVDVKDPSQGALGMASESMLDEIAEVLERNKRSGSCALGEFPEWSGRAIPRISGRYGWCKMGLAGCARSATWEREWQQVRDEIDAVGERRRWIAVIYADWSQAQAPAPRKVVEVAARTGCVGVLLDTWSKSAPGTLDLWTREELVALRRDCFRRGLKFALAGRIFEEDLHHVAAIRPDVLGVRSAACRGFDRRAVIDLESIMRLQKKLRSACAGGRADLSIES